MRSNQNPIAKSAGTSVPGDITESRLFIYIVPRVLQISDHVHGFHCRLHNRGGDRGTHRCLAPLCHNGLSLSSLSMVATCPEQIPGQSLWPDPHRWPSGSGGWWPCCLNSSTSLSSWISTVLITRMDQQLCLLFPVVHNIIIFNYLETSHELYQSLFAHYIFLRMCVDLNKLKNQIHHLVNLFT